MRSLHRVLAACAVVAAGLATTSAPAAADELSVTMGCYPGVDGPGTFRCEAWASQQFVAYLWSGVQNATILQPRKGRIVNGQCTPGLVSEVSVTAATPQEQATATDTFTCV